MEKVYTGENDENKEKFYTFMKMLDTVTKQYKNSIDLIVNSTTCTGYFSDECLGQLSETIGLLLNENFENCYKLLDVIDKTFDSEITIKDQ